MISPKRACRMQRTAALEIAQSQLSYQGARLTGRTLQGSAAEKRGLWEGVGQEPLRRALFCVFLCSEVIFSCKSHRNFFQKLPLQCRHFLENPLAKNRKMQLLDGRNRAIQIENR